MQSIRTVNLCPECGACPEIVFRENRVLIGEEGNLVELKVDEWNTIVEKVQSGEIGKI
ncbi:MAG: hypothetical protein RIG61_11645 [Deltaproteobacteria bacterium]